MVNRLKRMLQRLTESIYGTDRERLRRESEQTQRRIEERARGREHAEERGKERVDSEVQRSLGLAGEEEWMKAMGLEPRNRR